MKLTIKQINEVGRIIRNAIVDDLQEWDDGGFDLDEGEVHVDRLPQTDDPIPSPFRISLYPLDKEGLPKDEPAATWEITMRRVLPR